MLNLNYSRFLRISDSFLVIITILFIVPRIFVYLHQLDINNGWANPYYDLYYNGLTDHFWEYILLSTNIPPLTHIINGFVFLIFGKEISYGYLIFMLLVFILDCFSVIMLYFTSQKLGSSKTAAFLVSALYSLVVLPFEIWRQGMHYDHYTLPLSLTYTYALSCFYRTPNIRFAFMLAGASSLLVMQSSAAAYSAPVVSLVTTVLINHKYGLLRMLRLIIVTVGIPVLIAFGISTKNYLLSGSFSTSSKSGPAMMMFVRGALSNDEEKIAKVLSKSQAPQWYVYCYQNAMVPIRAVPNTHDFKTWIRLAKDFGTCFPRTETVLQTGINNQYWPYDLTILRSVIDDFGEKRLLNLIDADMYDMQFRKYLFAGYSYELSPRWIGAYGSVSMRIGKWLLLNEPSLYLSHMLRTHNNLYYGRGPLFLSNVVHNTSGGKIMSCIAEIYKYISRLIYPLVFVYGIYLLLCLFLRVKLHNQDIYSFLILLSLIFFTSLLYSSTADIENDRYFFQITPYIFLALSFFITRVEHVMRVACKRLITN